MIFSLDYTLQSQEARAKQARSLQIDDNCLGWTILLMNRGEHFDLQSQTIILDQWGPIHVFGAKQN